MKNNLKIFLIALMMLSTPVWGKTTPSIIKQSTFSLVRNYLDFSELPRLKLINRSDKHVEYKVTTTLTNAKGNVVFSASSKISANANAENEIDPFNGKRSNIKEKVMLYTSLITGEGGTTKISGFFGESKPVLAKSADVFGINVHLSWYDPHIRWKLLQMMKRAGITQIRMDFTFRDIKDKKIIERDLNNLKESLLAIESFGFRPLILIGYFPSSFYKSKNKLQMAYEWAKYVATMLKGRADFNYGNETNSGWAGYGSAADMANLNNAFALGTTAADQQALKGSFGIAEGLEAYVAKFIEDNTINYLNAYCIHPYCGTPEAGIAKSVATKKLIRRTGGTQQVWCTEVGFQVDSKDKLNTLTGELTGVAGFSKKNQAQLLPRFYTLAKSHGIDRVYWYNFFGMHDSETFWLVDKDFKPRPAYSAYTECSKQLKNTTAIEGTQCNELIQRHYFRRSNGSVVMVAWALKDGIRADFKLPLSTSVVDYLGTKIKIPADGILSLGHSLVYIQNPPSDKLYRKDVIVSPMDGRNFNKPLFRFTTKAGQNIKIPFSVFNSSANTINVIPALSRSNPDWHVNLPPVMTVGAYATSTESVTISTPLNVVSGVEYEFTFIGLVDDIQRTYPFTIRIKTEGDFPYEDLMQRSAETVYKHWSSFCETMTGVGNPQLMAKNKRATIDGDLKEWGSTEFYPIDQKFQWKLRDPGVLDTGDWSGVAALRWDNEFLYAAFLIRDDYLGFTDQLSRDWRDSDNIRIFLSSVIDKDKRSERITENDLLLIMAPTGVTRTEGSIVNAASLGGFVRQDAESKIIMSRKIWKNGYLLEVAIPFKLFNAKPRENVILGLNIMADDCDDNFRQHVAMTFLKNFNYWNSPKALGSVKLVK